MKLENNKDEIIPSLKNEVSSLQNRVGKHFHCWAGYYTYTRKISPPIRGYHDK